MNTEIRERIKRKKRIGLWVGILTGFLLGGLLLALFIYINIKRHE